MKQKDIPFSIGSLVKVTDTTSDYYNQIGEIWGMSITTDNRYYVVFKPLSKTSCIDALNLEPVKRQQGMI